ncbi:GNAT family N-acetyltransferase [Vallitalea guaymasensis]|uniref:GNAT family N-acetyltransferase n=1 Tax=Vallitalea guaymasensis TaxID=1185412 RepID=A0A8J8SBN6_9FIRM|nr:GNAT family protein [Vallitalea guaymasensis]QUH28541.1 GNAT family N-acetyltransferase [Vallitalea guaymasensis]
MIRIISDRLLIRDHIEEDLKTMHELLSSEKTMFYLPEIRTKNLNESKENLQIAIDEASSTNRSKFFFAITDRFTNSYIGEIGLTKLNENKYGNVMDLGYFIKEIFWGKGIVTEASKAVINYAFENLNTIKIETGCIEDNKGSERVMIKLGMIKEIDYKRQIVLHTQLYDRVKYRLFKEEWK